LTKSKFMVWVTASTFGMQAAINTRALESLIVTLSATGEALVFIT
jgi:hypothetical protein